MCPGRALAAGEAAPATRVGYLLYAVNLFVWAWMLRGAVDPEPVDEGGGGPASSTEAADGGAPGTAEPLVST